MVTGVALGLIFVLQVVHGDVHKSAEGPDTWRTSWHDEQMLLQIGEWNAFHTRRTGGTYADGSRTGASLSQSSALIARARAEAGVALSLRRLLGSAVGLAANLKQVLNVVGPGVDRARQQAEAFPRRIASLKASNQRLETLNEELRNRSQSLEDTNAQLTLLGERLLLDSKAMKTALQPSAASQVEEDDSASLIDAASQPQLGGTALGDLEQPAIELLPGGGPAAGALQSPSSPALPDQLGGETSSSGGLEDLGNLARHLSGELASVRGAVRDWAAPAGEDHGFQAADRRLGAADGGGPPGIETNEARSRYEERRRLQEDNDALARELAVVERRIGQLPPPPEIPRAPSWQLGTS